MLEGLAAGGLGVAGDIAGYQSARAENSKQAKRNRAFQQYMSSTAYQRAAKDLEKAGLNRVLALGSPASTPSGAQSSVQAPKLGSTGVEAASARQAIEQSKAQEALLTEQKRKTSAEADQAEFWKRFYNEANPVLDEAIDNLKKGLGSSSTDFRKGAKNWLDKAESLFRSGATDAKDAYLAGPKTIIRFLREGNRNAKEYVNKLRKDQ